MKNKFANKLQNVKSSTPRRRPPAAAAEERSATRRARSEEARTETMPAESWNRHKTTKAKRRPRGAGPQREREREREKEIARSEKEIVNYGWTNKRLVANLTQLQNLTHPFVRWDPPFFFPPYEVDWGQGISPNGEKKFKLAKI